MCYPNHLVCLGHSVITDSTEHMIKVLYNNLEMFNQRTKMQKIIHFKNITKETTDNQS